MKTVFLATSVLFILLACASQEETLQKTKPTLDPQVQNWMKNRDVSSNEQLGVLVTASEALDNLSFLRKIKENYYTGRVTVKQIQQLLADPRVKRISTGISRLHNNK